MKPTREEPFTRLHYEVRLLALPANIGLGWKRLTMRNALAFLTEELINLAKRFKEQVPYS